MPTTRLPRNALARNAQSHRRKDAINVANKSTKDLIAICDKHKVGELVFKDCKFASEKGDVAFIEHDVIRGNMRSGIILVKAKSICPSYNTLYDVVDIQNKKKERDQQKQNEELQSIKAEIERLNETPDSVLDKNVEHQKILNQLVEDIDNNKFDNSDCDHEFVNECDNECDNEYDDKYDHECDQCEHHCRDPACDHSHEHVTESKKKLDYEAKKRMYAKIKRDKAIRQMQEELAKKADAKEGNKFYRNFMKDIKSKFSIEEQADYFYFEVKSNVTDMVITKAKVYKIILPSTKKMNELYMLIVGDLQMKSDLIRQIDPLYKNENIAKHQNDFLDRIRAIEQLKTMESPENLIEDEIDELDELDDLELDMIGMPADDDVLNDTVPELESIIPNPSGDPAMIYDLLSPQIIELKNSNC